MKNVGDNKGALERLKALNPNKTPSVLDALGVPSSLSEIIPNTNKRALGALKPPADQLQEIQIVPNAGATTPIKPVDLTTKEIKIVEETISRIDKIKDTK